MSSASAIASQQHRIALGLCQVCGEPQSLISKRFCQQHLEHLRTKARNRFRRLKGVPLDEPLHYDSIAGMKRQLCLDLEAAFRRVISH